MSTESSPRLPSLIERTDIRPTSIGKLCNGEVPIQDGIQSDVRVRRTQIGWRPMKPYRLTSGELVVIGPQITGKELTILHHLAAPDKIYGPDEKDTISDWENLYNGKEANVERLERHRAIPGWKEYFEPKRALLLDFIKNGYADSPEGDLFVRPVIRLHSIEHGKPQWNLADLDEEIVREISNRDGVIKDPAKMILPMLGPLFVAAYSPDITSDWPKYMGYDLQDGESQHFSQIAAATQTLPLTIAHADDLLDGEIIKNLFNLGRGATFH